MVRHRGHRASGARRGSRGVQRGLPPGGVARAEAKSESRGLICGDPDWRPRLTYPGTALRPPSLVPSCVHSDEAHTARRGPRSASKLRQRHCSGFQTHRRSPAGAFTWWYTSRWPQCRQQTEPRPRCTREAYWDPGRIYHPDRWTPAARLGAAAVGSDQPGRTKPATRDSGRPGRTGPRSNPAAQPAFGGNPGPTGGPR
jgi:hypothetical protein